MKMLRLGCAHNINSENGIAQGIAMRNGTDCSPSKGNHQGSNPFKTVTPSIIPFNLTKVITLKIQLDP